MGLEHIRNLVLISLILIFIGSATATQPKILEVTDNFGNVVDVSGAENGVTSVSVDDQLVIEDNTEVTLCVSEVRAENKSSLVYDFQANSPDLSNSVSGTTDNCHTWNLDREDYSSYVSFRIRVGNQDEVEYSAYNRDYVVDYQFTNPVPEGNGDKGTSRKFTYDTIEISQSVYENLKEKSPDSSSEPSIPEGQKLVDEDDWKELQERPTSSEVERLEEKTQQKNQKISSLQERIAGLQNQISELESTVERLNTTTNTEQKSESVDEISNNSEQAQGNSSINQEAENTPNNENVKKKRPGFINNLLASIFG